MFACQLHSALFSLLTLTVDLGHSTWATCSRTLNASFAPLVLIIHLPLKRTHTHLQTLELAEQAFTLWHWSGHKHSARQSKFNKLATLFHLSLLFHLYTGSSRCVAFAYCAKQCNCNKNQRSTVTLHCTTPALWSKSVCFFVIFYQGKLFVFCLWDEMPSLLLSLVIVCCSCKYARSIQWLFINFILSSSVIPNDWLIKSRVLDWIKCSLLAATVAIDASINETHYLQPLSALFPLSYTFILFHLPWQIKSTAKTLLNSQIGYIEWWVNECCYCLAEHYTVFLWPKGADGSPNWDCIR